MTGNIFSHIESLVLIVVHGGREQRREQGHLRGLRPHGPQHPALSQNAVQGTHHIGSMDPEARGGGGIGFHYIHSNW